MFVIVLCVKKVMIEQFGKPQDYRVDFFKVLVST